MDRKFFKEVAQMTQDALDSFVAFESDPTKANDFLGRCRKVARSFIHDGEIKSEIRENIPLRQELDFRNAVFHIRDQMTLSHGRGQNRTMQSALNLILNICKSLASSSSNSRGRTIFYSWQSNRPNNTNRTFIEKSITMALEGINRDVKLELRPEEPRLEIDKNTDGLPGSPDIINGILEKIDNSLIFIADVSMVMERQPNPNVMFELGYAKKALGDKRILMIFNEAYGKARDLPFDLGLKRQITYCCAEHDEDKAAKKRDLAKIIKSKIEEILVYDEEN